jgi:hypothetical protein
MSHARLVALSLLASAAATIWAPPTRAQAPAFPLKSSASGRYLVDSANIPFFYQADTPWMILRLPPDDARHYIDDRRNRGFTALQIQLTGFMDMRDHAGEAPFLGDHDLTRPNEAYFAHADALIRDASDRGFALAIAPLWSGCCGEGWTGTDKDGRLKPLDAAGPEAAHRLGQWIGQRYARFPNILWIMGGDHNPDQSQAVIDALARGIHEAAPHQLITVHNAPDHASADFYDAAPWLTLNAAYSYRELQAPVFREWSRDDHKVRPIFLSESGYELEANDKRPGTPFRIRRQAYASVLNGALVGHAYGHRDIWPFTPRWREALNDPGARHLAHVKTLFASRPWWSLVPDQGNAFVTSDRGAVADDGYVSAARSDDGLLAILYIPNGRAVSLNREPLKGPSSALWFDPTDGSTRPADGTDRFTPPGPNAAGESDWVLVLQRPAH